MAQFQFRLASLLQLRQAERERRQSLLAETLAQLRQLQVHRGALESELRDQQRSTRAIAGPGLLDVGGLRRADRFRSSLGSRLARLAEQERSVEQEIGRRREALVEADREVRVLEKLQARQHARHRAEQAQTERNELDDVALRATNRRPIA
jgi:flagellar export protein FliJ